ncbi:MAG TPA: hypothetical protein PKO06_01800 [Candidatus Ozemobacteraceae bacterium]|nr:hypothetical protein [Candidatus Ozemobacteraceae bacterium]
MSQSVMPEPISRFFKAAQPILKAEKGREILIEDRSDGYGNGYSPTPIEVEADAAIVQVREWITQHPEQLSGDHLTSILQAVTFCSRAVDEYRARYEGAAGDYDDFYSPLAYSLQRLFESLRTVLTRLDNEGVFPLTQVPIELLRTQVRVCEGGVFTQELYKSLLSDAMQTGRQEPFLEIVRQQAEEVRALVLQMLAATPDRKVWIMRDLVHRFFHTQADVADDVADGFLVSLRDGMANVREEAERCLGRCGFRVFPFVRDRFVSASGNERLLLLRVLKELQRNAYSAEKPVVTEFLNHLPPER